MNSISLLQNKKLKATKARIALLDILQKKHQPLDAREIFINLREINIKADLATVYRILEKLSKEKIIKQVDFREGKFRYELDSDHHHHLVCNSCSKITPVHDVCFQKTEGSIKEKYNFLVQDHSLEFFGLCNKCQ